MVSDTNKKTIYIPLLNEGVPVYRPTLALDLGDNRFQVLPTSDYDALDEEWEFRPGAIVECVTETRDGKQVLVARRKVSEH